MEKFFSRIEKTSHGYKVFIMSHVLDTSAQPGVNGYPATTARVIETRSVSNINAARLYGCERAAQLQKQSIA